ncbi:MAG: tetratricopeptide repeat protein, partial [Leptolyngbyaceae cyanobacterium CAN_BIN12]|nr:tetratricopeptide repeat protein [Leptolyngbyaceae cyanobacterium CAN_BIN12]
MNHSEDSQILYSHGHVLRKLGHHASTVDKYDAILTAQPTDHRAWNCRGYALEAAGQYKEALASFDRAIALQPKYALAWQGKGIVLAKLIQY